MNPLETLYGENFLELVLEELKKLAANSNIPFDKKYVDLGLSFLMINAKDIVEGKKAKPTLLSLVSRSFGEAAIYKYNVCGGSL